MEKEMMTYKMMFVMIEEYSEYSYNKKIWVLLDIHRTLWQKYKKENVLPLKHFKTICDYVGIGWTDDSLILCEGILRKYKEECEHIAISGYGALTNFDVGGAI